MQGSMNLVLVQQQRSLSHSTMASMRQRKADAAVSVSPSSRGLRSDDESSRGNTQIVIEDVDAFDSYYRPAPPRFIPDKHYKDFMLGKAVNKKEASIWPDSKTCASRCVGFSWVGASFLVS
jgi:hypothetical protein